MENLYAIGIVSGNTSCSARVVRISEIGEHGINIAGMPTGTEQEMEQELFRLLNDEKFVRDYGLL